MRKSHQRTSQLIGRDRELRALAERIDGVSDRCGGAVLVRGAAGMGKSSLLNAARAHGLRRGFQILTTTGIQSESRLPFAGLHQILRPVLQQIDALPNSYGNAVRAAFGLNDQVAPSPYLIALSVLELLGDCAESKPVMLLADDAHWLDGPTADVLAFISRRLESEPIVLISVVTDGFQSPLLATRMHELRVERLSDEDSSRLLDAHAQTLARALRDRILNDAAGNPLALVELSVALKSAGDADSALLRPTLPVTDRLRQAFTHRLSELTPEARCLLQVAAADDSGVVDQLLRASSDILRTEITLAAAAEAATAGLIEVDGQHLRFRHPLMRSAIQQTLTLAERQSAHQALADAMRDDPDRRAWHRAAAAVGRNEEIAAELEAVATRAQRRGATSVALEAIERAAELAGDPAQRGVRMIRGAFHALVLGRHSEVIRLLNEIDDLDLAPLDRLHAAWLREVCEQKPSSGTGMTTSFIEIADRMLAEGDVQRGFQALLSIVFRCWWSNPDERTRAQIVAVAERFPVSETDARLLYVLALASPVERGAIVIERISRLWAEFHGNAGPESQLLGVACMAVGDFVHAEAFMDQAISACRTNGSLGVLATKLALQAWTKIPRGDWKDALSMASESARIADEIGQKNWITMAKLATATISAYRGDTAAAESLVSEADEVLLPLGAISMLGLAQYSRGAAALADGRHDEAYQHLSRVFDPADSAHHPHVRSWALVDLVEAAVHSGHVDQASHFVYDLESIAQQTGSPLLRAALETVRPMLVPGGSEQAFQSSLDADLAHWPFYRARLQLAYGIWLRRDRRVADSRAPLRAARDTLSALGAVSWAERARQELRASGETSRRRTIDLSDSLSPQELQIAKLAAAGLSNKEIGQQLFLSHRTIGSHLYRIFPKLGITARSHLRAALQDRSTQQED